MGNLYGMAHEGACLADVDRVPEKMYGVKCMGELCGGKSGTRLL